MMKEVSCLTSTFCYVMSFLLPAKLHIQGYQWKNLHYLSQAAEPHDVETRQKALFEAWKVPVTWPTHTVCLSFHSLLTNQTSL